LFSPFIFSACSMTEIDPDIPHMDDEHADSNGSIEGSDSKHIVWKRWIRYLRLLHICIICRYILCTEVMMWSCCRVKKTDDKGKAFTLCTCREPSCNKVFHVLSGNTTTCARHTAVNHMSRVPEEERAYYVHVLQIMNKSTCMYIT